MVRSFRDAVVSGVMALACLVIPWFRDEMTSPLCWVVAVVFAGVWVCLGVMCILTRKDYDDR